MRNRPPRGRHKDGALPAARAPEGRRTDAGQAQSKAAPRARERSDRQRRPALAADRAVVGRHAVLAVLTHQRARAERVFVDDGARAADVAEAARRAGVPVEVVDRTVLDALTDGDLVHQGVVLAALPFPYVDLEDIVAREGDQVGLILDGVVDPRNLGAAVRAAYALGADFVGVMDRHAAPPTASAYKASAGALARVPIVLLDNLRRRLDQLKERGYWVIGAEASGDAPPWSVDMRGRAVIVIGGEDRGLRRLTREACDHVVAIPMEAADMSLNAADAATVLLYEALRQRKTPFPRP